MGAINEGLEGVAVGETAISLVDGERGELSYRGESIEHLVGRPFAAVAWLLLFGDWPTAQQEQQLQHLKLTLDEAKNLLLKGILKIPTLGH